MVVGIHCTPGISAALNGIGKPMAERLTIQTTPSVPVPLPEQNKPAQEKTPQAKPLVEKHDLVLLKCNLAGMAFDLFVKANPQLNTFLPFRIWRFVSMACFLYSIPWKSTSTLEKATLLNPLIWIGSCFFPEINMIRCIATTCGIARNSLPKLMDSVKQVTKRPLAAIGSAFLHAVNIATPAYFAYRAYQSIETKPDSSEGDEGDKWDDFDKKKAKFNKKWEKSSQPKTPEVAEEYYREWYQLQDDWFKKWYDLKSQRYSEDDLVRNPSFHDPKICGTSRPLSHFDNMDSFDRLTFKQLDPTCFSDAAKALGLQIGENCKRSLESAKIKKWTCQAIQLAMDSLLARLDLSKDSNDPRMPDAKFNLNNFAKTLNEACRCYKYSSDSSLERLAEA